MKQVNKLKIMLIGLAFANFVSIYSMNTQEASIHPIWYFRNSGVQGKPSTKTQYRTITDQLGATENAKIPQKTQGIVRVATYNVHFWLNPYGAYGSGYSKHDTEAMLKVIAAVNADVLILQEVGGEKQAAWNVIKPALEKMGYKYSACASTGTGGVYKDGALYNCIYSKLPFVGKTVEKQYVTNPDPKISRNAEQRNFVGAQIQLTENKKFSVYGTHLEVRPIMVKSPDGKGRGLTPDMARKEQMQELLDYIKNNDTNDNVIIGADFNTFRKQDLEAYNITGTTLWTLMEKVWSSILKDTADQVPQGLGHLVDKTSSAATSALDYVDAQGYKDSFARGGFTPPQFTVWTGTRIDFLFLSPKWNLGLKGGYVFYNWASDHIPVIVDIDPSQSVKSVAPVVKPAISDAAKKAVAEKKKPVIGQKR